MAVGFGCLIASNSTASLVFQEMYVGGIESEIERHPRRVHTL